MDFRAALLDQTRSFGELIASSDPDDAGADLPGLDAQATVPPCRARKPLGGTDYLRAPGLTSGPPRGPRREAARRSGRRDRLAQHAGAAQVLKSVDQIGTDARVWTFLGPKPAGWWVRRRVHEAAVHRADAALAVGTEFVLPADLAADAVSEWLEIATGMAKKRHGVPSRWAPASTCMRPTTVWGRRGSGRWSTTRTGSSGLTRHGKGTVALKGPAHKLLLAVTRRGTACRPRAGSVRRHRNLGRLARPHTVLRGVGFVRDHIRDRDRFWPGMTRWTRTTSTPAGAVQR